MAVDLLERYLQAVGQYLPAATKDDTIDELRANLLDQIEAREHELGHPLTDSELGDILRAHGKPEVVALRYLPQQSLIGPTIFPFYRFTLVRVLPVVVLCTAIANAIQFMAAPQGSLADAFVRLGLGLASSLLLTVAILTIIFATIERTMQQDKLAWKWNQWDPAKLPALKTPTVAASPRSVVKRVIDLAVHCFWMAYVLWVPWHPFWLMGPGLFYLDKLDVAFAPVWHTFYVLLIALLTIQLAMKFLAFLPAFQRWQKPLKLGTDLLGLIAVGLLAWVSTYFVPAAPAVDISRIAEVNHAVGLAFRIVFLITLAGFLQKAWKYWKRREPPERFVLHTR